MKYVVKHINTHNLRHKNMFLKYYANIDFRHCVFRVQEATHFETRDKAKQIMKKFKHPDLWEIVRIKDVEKEK